MQWSLPRTWRGDITKLCYHKSIIIFLTLFPCYGSVRTAPPALTREWGVGLVAKSTLRTARLAVSGGRPSLIREDRVLSARWWSAAIVEPLAGKTEVPGGNHHKRVPAEGTHMRIPSGETRERDCSTPRLSVSVAVWICLRKTTMDSGAIYCPKKLLIQKKNQQPLLWFKPATTSRHGSD